MHEYNANWIPKQPARRNYGTRCLNASVGLIVKVLFVGIVAGYLLGLVQQAVQKDTRAKIEAYCARY